jgi:uncharacterized protein YkwD
MRCVTSLIAGVFCVLAFAGVAQGRQGSPRLDRSERALLRAINSKRAQLGLRAVRSSPQLARAADYHSNEMLAGSYFAHTSSNGASFDVRIRSFTQSKSVGETLAMLDRCGRHMARTVVKMWMDSPGHRAILTSSQFRRVGIGRRSGRLDGGRACLVTADFASRH